MLDIYDAVNPANAFSADGDWTRPLTIAADGFHGQVLIRKLYLRNDNINKWYDTISISVQQTLGGIDWIGGTDGHSWKFIEGDTEPSDAEWTLVAPMNSINMANIGSVGSGDIVTYLPFWVRVEINDHTAVRSLVEMVSMTIDYEEYDV